MVDPARLHGLLERLSSETRELRALAAIGRDDLLADSNLLAAVKYRFVVAIEVCIDIGEHIAASERLRAPTSFADTFAVLAEGGFVESADVDAFEAMARFRNLLVHGYAEVDDRRVVEVLQTRLDDFDRFGRSIARRLTEE